MTLKPEILYLFTTHYSGAPTSVTIPFRVAEEEQTNYK